MIKKTKVISLIVILLSVFILHSPNTAFAVNNNIVIDDNGTSGETVVVPPKGENRDIAVGYQEFNKVITPFLTFALAVTILTVILAFIYLFVRLAASGDNPAARNDIFKELLVLFVITVILGSFAFFYFFFYGLFR